MRLRHGAPPSLIQAGARPVSQLPTPVDSALAGDVLPYDSKIFRLFSDSVKKRFFAVSAVQQERRRLLHDDGKLARYLL